MTLTRAQFGRAAAMEEHQQRLGQLAQMSPGSLHALLTGDPVQAAAWIRSAAECGLAAAQVRLGRMLLEGREVERDERAAFVWFSRAAAQGDIEALNMLGRCHENGWGVALDLERAAASYRTSAEGGHDWGQYNFGNLLFDGRGVAPDQPQALRWYLRAASRGHGRAMNIVARCLEEGWGCRRSLEDAAYWYQQSARSGYFRGQFNHALLLAERGLVESAAEWFWKAASGGDAQMRDAIAARLAAAAHPTLRQVRTRILRLGAAACGGNRRS
ncbi:MAG TPA: tetratricopeptide repeat protein [Steroidobacteraceae bacterium]|nr:tetratricopeptide repeat protein [Steroidobacteraceae bacterium]